MRKTWHRKSNRSGNLM